MTDVRQTLYVTGHDGVAPEDISVQVGSRLVPGPEQYSDVAQLPWNGQTAPLQAMVYLGLSRASRDFTCYLLKEGEKITGVLGLYSGNGIVPEPLDKQYGFAMESFHDAGGQLICQYQFNKMFPFSAAHARLLPIVEGATFAGDIFFLKYKLPKMVLGAVVRAADGTFASTVQGWGNEQGFLVPDEHTLVPIGSITKAFTGHLLARMVAKKAAHFTEPLGENPAIRFIDLVTHTSGLPREVEPNIDFKAPKDDLPSVLFPPGTGALYSNVGFNALSRTLYARCQQPGDTSYYDLLKRELLSPLHLDHTSFDTPPWKAGSPDDRTQNLFGGYDSDGKPWPQRHDPTPRGASGLYSTPEDILGWLAWHLQSLGDPERLDAETRLLDHAAYVQRDGLKPVFGLDESGHMDAMGLGWVVMMPGGDRPFILQKAGGTNGVFSFAAFSPARGIGLFMSIDKFDVGASMEMAAMINDIITTSAPR
ncbi:serine hydrolase [Corallococcus sp. bb12-1]|uniref:serine hydrolase n=1 Tax=Corallococcus sp. bb12-1 TaxID=2996784 RepID=UPI0022707419|nr:serine hydrolase [Corallococcus sp. bb12-1]MCY1046049.1 serine hydrolase [Corallococcus sp. bb12-1]